MRSLLIIVALAIVAGSFIHSEWPQPEEKRECAKWHVWNSEIPEVSVAKCLEWRNVGEKTSQ